MTDEHLFRAILARQLRWAMGRGLPPQEAEDVVFEAFERARRSFDAERGAFDTYVHALVRNACASWWRRRQTRERVHQHLRLLAPLEAAPDPPAAAAYQARIVDALDDDEREVFMAWAMQKHVGKGQRTSEEWATSLGLTKVQYENAKRRLKVRLNGLLEEFGWSVAQLLHGVDDVEDAG
ncbi:MAG: sigma factor [Myxococcota bacterium]